MVQIASNNSFWRVLSDCLSPLPIAHRHSHYPSTMSTRPIYVVPWGVRLHFKDKYYSTLKIPKRYLGDRQSLDDADHHWWVVSFVSELCQKNYWVCMILWFGLLLMSWSYRGKLFHPGLHIVQDWRWQWKRPVGYLLRSSGVGFKGRIMRRIPSLTNCSVTFWKDRRVEMSTFEILHTDSRAFHNCVR